MIAPGLRLPPARLNQVRHHAVLAHLQRATAEGTVAQAEAAFGAKLNVYSVKGLELRAPATPLSVPDTLAGSAVAVMGLDQTAQLVRPDRAPEPKAPPSPEFVNAPPCSAFWAEKLATGFPNPYGAGAPPWAPCGYTPAQLRVRARGNQRVP